MSEPAESRDLALNEIVCPCCADIVTHPYAARSVMCPSCTAEILLEEHGEPRVIYRDCPACTRAGLRRRSPSDDYRCPHCLGIFYAADLARAILARGPDESEAAHDRLERERRQVALESLPESLASRFDALSLDEVVSLSRDFTRERMRLAAEGGELWRVAGTERIRAFIGAPFRLDVEATEAQARAQQLANVASSVAVYDALIHELVGQLPGIGAGAAPALTAALLASKSVVLDRQARQASRALVSALVKAWTRPSSAHHEGSPYVPALLAIPCAALTFGWLRGAFAAPVVAAIACAVGVVGGALLGQLLARTFSALRWRRAPSPVEALLARFEIAQALCDPALRAELGRELQGPAREAWTRYLARVPPSQRSQGV